jgi:hypothetical protein
VTLECPSPSPSRGEVRCIDGARSCLLKLYLTDPSEYSALCTPSIPCMSTKNSVYDENASSPKLVFKASSFTEPTGVAPDRTLRRQPKDRHRHDRVHPFSCGINIVPVFHIFNIALAVLWEPVHSQGLECPAEWWPHRSSAWLLVVGTICYCQCIASWYTPTWSFLGMAPFWLTFGSGITDSTQRCSGCRPHQIVGSRYGPSVQPYRFCQI